MNVVVIISRLICCTIVELFSRGRVSQAMSSADVNVESESEAQREYNAADLVEIMDILYPVVWRQEGNFSRDLCM